MNNILLLRSIQILFLTILFSIQLFPQLDSAKLNNYNIIADQIRQKALVDKEGYELLRELCDIGPRLSGSENSLQAIYWAEEKLKNFGVDKVWLQPVMVPHWERRNVETAVIIKNKSSDHKSLNILSLGGSVSTPENGVTANVIEVKSFTELKERQNEVKGKIVFFNRPLDESLFNKLKEIVGQIPGYHGMRSRQLVKMKGGNFEEALRWVNRHKEKDTQEEKTLPEPLPYPHFKDPFEIEMEKLRKENEELKNRWQGVKDRTITDTMVHIPKGKKLITLKQYMKEAIINSGWLLNICVNVPDGYKIEKVVLKKIK